MTVWYRRWPRPKQRFLSTAPRHAGNRPGCAARLEVPYWPQSSHIGPMKTFLAILIAILMFATLAVLFAGLIGLARNTPNPARSNRLMRWRVILQGTVILLFMLLMGLLRS